MKHRLVVVGCGRLAGVVVDAYKSGLLKEYEIVGTYSRTFAHAEQLALSVGDGCRACSTLDELLELEPNFLVEVATPQAMRDIAIPVLESGCSIVSLSIGAFAEDSFYEQVKDVARRSNSRVYIASGATGGFDILRTATLMGGATARFFNEKGPRGLRGTSVYDDSLEREQRVVFEGSAKQAIEKFPTRVNVTVAASRASVGPDNMRVMIQSSPYFTGDTQRVEIRNPQVHAVVDIYSATSEIAGWSAVAVLQNIVSPIVF